LILSNKWPAKAAASLSNLGRLWSTMARRSRADFSTLSAETMALTSAIPVAHPGVDIITDLALLALMPPIATTGKLVEAQIRLKPSMPSGTLSGFVGVENTASVPYNAI